MPWNPPLNQWFVDADKPPYYPYDEGSGDLSSPNVPSMHDTPGPTVGWWRLQDLSYEFETAAVCSKSAVTNGSDKGVGDVFGSIQWGFSYFVQGPAWNRKTVARKMYINNTVWTDEEMKTITVNAMGGEEQIQIGGPSIGGYKGYVAPQEPSEEMKKVLSKYFP